MTPTAEGAEPDETRLFAAALSHDPDGIELPYLVLDHVATRYRLADAVLVLRPGLLGPQLFSRGRVPINPERAAALLANPVGLYTEPTVGEPTLSAALAGICNSALSAQVARRAAVVDEASGLASRAVIEASLVRAASSGARYGWTFTAVMLATGGEGSPAERWSALTRALGMAARVGDEVGVARPGRALAILGNAGPDVVRPYVARVRAALSAAGDEAVDLHAATVTSPMETVDPEAIWTLLTERLDEIAGPPRHAERASETAGPGRAHQLPAALELALRGLPRVVSVGTAPHPSGVGYQICVVAVQPADNLAALAGRRAREFQVEAPVVVVPSAGAPAADDAMRFGPDDLDRPADAEVAESGWAPAPAGYNGTHQPPGAGTSGATSAAGTSAAGTPAGATPASGTPSGGTSFGSETESPGHIPQVTATAAPQPATPATTASAPATPATTASAPATPATTASAPAPAAAPDPVGARPAAPLGPEAPAPAADRVTLVDATFDVDSGVSEIRLALGGITALGAATVGPLAGGAQAVLAALAELGIRVPYYLVSAERAHTVPGVPVVVVLAPRRPAGSDGSAGEPLAERIGVANGADDVAASARATLSALNRYLSAAGSPE